MQVIIRGIIWDSMLLLALEVISFHVYKVPSEKLVRDSVRHRLNKSCGGVHSACMRWVMPQLGGLQGSRALMGQSGEDHELKVISTLRLGVLVSHMFQQCGLWSLSLAGK